MYRDGMCIYFMCIQYIPSGYSIPFLGWKFWLEWVLALISVLFFSPSKEMHLWWTYANAYWFNMKHVVDIIFHWQGTQRMLVNLPTLKSNRGLIWRFEKASRYNGSRLQFKVKYNQQYMVLCFFMCIWFYRSSKCLSHTHTNLTVRMCVYFSEPFYFDLRSGEVTRRI